MVASALQLQSIGLQDIYLTSKPKIDFFKYNYYQYINFATELVSLQLDDVIDFGKTVNCTIPPLGHILSKLYLRIKVPALMRTSGTYLSWAETLGYAIFNEGVDLEVGGVVVDTFYPGFWDIRESFVKPDNDLGANLLLLRGDTYISARHNAENENDLVIPLKFWFTRDYKMSLPIAAMRYQNIKLRFKLREFQDCINYDGSAPATNASISEAELLAEYIFLDDDALLDFASREHEFLIEQVRYTTERISASAGTYGVSLESFNNPCKELMFGCVETANILANNYYNYTNNATQRNIVSRISLVLEGKKRFDKIPEVFSRLGYAHATHSSVPLKYVYSVPFCIKPEDNQPSGSLNLSLFDNKILLLDLVNSSPECTVYVYSVQYNIAVVSGGFLKFKFNL